MQNFKKKEKSTGIKIIILIIAYDPLSV